MAVDQTSGEVFVADTGNDRIQVYSPEGVFEREWGGLGSGDGQFSGPEGVGVSGFPPFDVYVADTNNNRVERFTHDGGFISAFGSSGSGPGQLDRPRNIAFDSGGSVYVGDTGANNRVTAFSPDGSFQNTVGGLATFTRLAGLTNALTRTTTFYATDAQQNKLVSFDTTGSAGTEFPSGVLDNPQGVAVDTENVGGSDFAAVFVADAGNHRVAEFGGAGPFVRSFGSLGAGEGQFQDPSGIAFSQQNKKLYVAEGNNCCARISVWKQIPDPVLGRSMDIQTDKGVVFFKPPGAKKFRKLKKVSLVLSGTIIDARKGTVGITSLTAAGALQSADFYSGIFRAVQKVQGKGLTDAQLVGGNFKRCPAGLRAAGHTPQRIRKLWGSGAGQFRTKGRFAAASIRGTTWLTDDRCDGTLIRVTQGAVSVRDLVKQTTVVLRTGQSYFARGNPRRGR